MTAIYKPIGIILGLLGGIVGRQVFNIIWGKIDDREPPEATTRDIQWSRWFFAIALQGAVFAVTKGLIARAGADVWQWVFGAWPGEETPERA